MGRISAAVGQLDLYFQHFQVVLAFELDLDVVGIDLDVLADHRHQIALQCGQVIGLGGAAAGAFVRQNDLKPFLGDAGGFLLFAQQE